MIKTEKQYKHYSSYRDIDKANDTRKHFGLPILVETKRQCLGCNNKFNSEGVHNKMCTSCRERASRNDCEYTI